MRKQKVMRVALLCGILSVSVVSGCSRKYMEIPADGEVAKETQVSESDKNVQENVSSEESDGQTEKNETDNFSAMRDTSYVPVVVKYEYQNEWKEQKQLFESKVAQLSLLDGEHAELEKALWTFNQNNVQEQKNTYEENLVYAEQQYASEPNMEAYEFDRDVILTRSDETLLSFAMTEYSYFGGAHPSYYITGKCYDTKTGKELSLRDVAADYDGIYEYVKHALEQDYDQDMFYENYQETLRDMFYEESSQSGTIQWTISSEGLEFYINQYDLAPYAAGRQYVEISFKERPELFQKEYMVNRVSYAKPISEGIGVLADVNGDGKEEEVLYSVSRDENGFGGAITVMCDGQSFSTEEFSGDEDSVSGAYSSEGYLLHLEDGRTYLYLEHLDNNDYRYINMFRLDQGVLSYVGSEGMGWYGVQILDPDSFILSTRLDILGTYSGRKIYHVGEDGHPETDDSAYQLNGEAAERTPMISTRELTVKIIHEDGSQAEETLPSGTSFILFQTDGSSYVDAYLSDGRICRISVEPGSAGWGWDIDGVSEEECFEQVPYAG